MLTLPHSLIIFDLETTDIALGDIEIVEVGALKLNTALEVVSSWSTLVQPSALDKYTDYCKNITGISRDDLANAPKWETIWRQFAEFTSFRTTRLAAWGCHFDFAVLQNQYKRLGLGCPHNMNAFDIRSMAYLVMSWYGMKPKGWSLEKICERLDISAGGSFHRAMADATYTHRILSRLGELLSK